jgi:pilus assembly protein CpaF
MLRVSIESSNSVPIVAEVLSLPCIIGKGSTCGIVLPSWRASKQHAEIRLSRVGLKLVDLGSLSGTWVNGDRIAEYGPLDPSDEILIAGYTLRLLHSDPLNSAAVASASPLVGEATGPQSASLSLTVSGSNKAEDSADFLWQTILMRRLFESVDFRRQDLNNLNSEQLKEEVSGLIEQLLISSSDIPSAVDRNQLKDRLIHEAVGLGPLEPLLADASVTEIMVNGPSEVFVERAGKLSKSDLRFSSIDALRAIVDRIVSPLGRRIDESSPMVDARLPDGSRVNVVIAPLAINGATMTIRKFSKAVLSPDNLVALGSASAEMIRFFSLCVKSRKNIVVSGGTGSGKTTLLNVLSNLIEDGERVLTIEDAAELKLAHTHWVALESRPTNAEGRGAVVIRDLVKNALRMRPDRIIVGECRGEEAMDMLQAMNTGHDGSLTTVHANSPRDALRRLEAMVMMSGMEMPLQAIREQIVGAVDFVIHQSRLASGARVITEVIEVVGMEGQRIQSQTLFKYDLVDRRNYGCDTIPQFLEDLNFRTDEEKSAILKLFDRQPGLTQRETAHV